jgi:hypothetical protein
MQYRATQRIQRNGLVYDAGDLLDLSSTEAAQLLEYNAVEPVNDPFAGILKTLPGGEQ